MNTPASSRKLRGGYYTSPELAAILCEWAIRSAADAILEPSCGDGVFVIQAAKRAGTLRRKEAARRLGKITGIEVNRAESQKAIARMPSVSASSLVEIVNADFFTWRAKNAHRTFDCVVGNPPFIRYQNFPEPSRSKAMQLLADQGLSPNRLTNSWVPFLVGAMSLLRERGCLAMVIPAEILQVSYAAQVRGFLADHFAKLDVIACNEMFFTNAEQEVVLLLADGFTRCPHAATECVIDLQQHSDLSSIVSKKSPLLRSPGEHKHLQHENEKWLKYFLSGAEIELMRELRNAPTITSLSTHAEVDIGIVTGNNEFFVLTREQVEQFDVFEYASPLIARSAHLKGAKITKEDWRKLSHAGQRVFLFEVSKEINGELSQAAKRYVRRGREAGVHEGFKCSIRKPWYSVPSVWSPDAFLFRQIYDFPRLIRNDLRAPSTDTIHRVRCKHDSSLVVENCYTYLTAASAEIEGRSYGGGVLELEPTEAERLLVPETLQRALPLSEMDRLVRSGRLGDALDLNNKLVLQKSGISKRDCGRLKIIWDKMRQRRRMRKKL